MLPLEVDLDDLSELVDPMADLPYGHIQKADRHTQQRDADGQQYDRR
jgi:hypothetical protein